MINDAPAPAGPPEGLPGNSEVVLEVKRRDEELWTTYGAAWN